MLVRTAIVLGVLAAAVVRPATVLAAPILEAYEWRQLRHTPTTELTAALPAFRAYGGTGVAIDISAVVDISEIPDTSVRAAEELRFTARLRSYVEAAAANGLTVKALAGSPRWVLPEVRYVNDIVVDYVGRFNAAAPSGRQLRGLVLDHEPWARPSWVDEAAKQTRYLLDTVREVAARARALPVPVPVTVTLPFWLDGTAEPTALTYQGTAMSPTQHVMRILATASPAHAVAIMAYRDRTGGSDGSIALASREFDLAAKYQGRVGVVIAQEITDVQPARITFCSEGPVALRAAIDVLAQTFGGRPGFGGFLINDLTTLTSKL